MPADFSMNPLVLVTGATQGIGKAIALLLAERGARVIATGRRIPLLEQLQKELPRSAKGEILIKKLDVTIGDDILATKRYVDELSHGTGVDVLINNAGFPVAGPLELVSDKELRSCYDVNVFGLMACVRAFAPQMRERRRGTIVNIGSIGGRISVPYLAVYDSTKFAVLGSTDGLRRELKPFGVDVILIEPGAIQGEFQDHEVEGLRPYMNGPYQKLLDVFLHWHTTELVKGRPTTRSVAEDVYKALVKTTAPIYVVTPYWKGLQNIFLATFLPAWLTDWLIGNIIGYGQVDL
eukprot:Clim_evm4s182 gene=Clim_evmTU4s182